jgi:hypothetical protein
MKKFILLLILILTLPVSALNWDYNNDRIVDWQDLGTFANGWLNPYDLISFSSFANEWMLEEPGTLMNYNNVGDDNAKGCYGEYYINYPDDIYYQSIQTFTPLTDYTITAFGLKVYRIGNAGTLRAWLYPINESGYPTGIPYAGGGYITWGSVALSVITDNPEGEWRILRLNTPTPLTAGTTYAIVVTNTASLTSSKACWRYATNGKYDLGTASYSEMGTYYNFSPSDFMFETYGE